MRVSPKTREVSEGKATNLDINARSDPPHLSSGETPFARPRGFWVEVRLHSLIRFSVPTRAAEVSR